MKAQMLARCELFFLPTVNPNLHASLSPNTMLEEV